MQQRLLAKRIIHYCPSQMYFEYNHGMLAEDGSNLGARPINLNLLNIPRSSAEIILAWDRIIDDYGCRALTNITDRLPAYKSYLNSWLPCTIRVVKWLIELGEI